MDSVSVDGGVASVGAGTRLGALYDSSSWPDFAALLADIEHQAGAQQLGVRAERFRGASAYLPKRGFPRYFNFAEGFPAVACADKL